MQTLTDPEWSIMLALWEVEEPVPRIYIQKKLEHLNWKTNTFNTYLTRLLEKGLITSASRGQTYYYKPLVKREEYLENEGKSILYKLFGGSLKRFVLSVSNTDAVDDAELDELRDFLNQLRGGEKDGE